MTDSNNIYSFGHFVLKPGLRELKCAGELVEIEPRAFDVLVYLVENRDRAVDKGELQDAIWPGVIVTETALTRAVMKARKAIGDDANRPHMIKTLHGHGYRFIAKLSSEETRHSRTPAAAEPAPASVPEAVEVNTPARVNLRTYLILGAVLTIIAVLGWMLLRPQPTLGNDTRIAVLPLQDNTDNPDLAWTRFGLMSYASRMIADDESMLVVADGSIIGLAENFGWNGDLRDPANDTLLDRLRQVYGATHMLAMELEPEGGALRMNYSLLLPDGDLQRGTIVGDAGTDLAHGVVQVVYGNLLRKSHLSGDIPLVSKDSFNNEAFARGMDLSLQGRCNEAVQFFRVIIEQEPGLFEPRFELAACLRIIGQQEEAESLLKSLIQEQRPLGNSRQLAQSLMTLGILYNRTGRLDLSDLSYVEALQISEALGDHELSARILQNQSIVARSRAELDEASRLLDLALLAYQDAGIEVLPGHFYSGRANLKMARGELVEAEVDLGLALNAFREVGDRRNEAMMLNNTGYLKKLQGRLEEAEAYHLRSLEIREEIGDRVGVGRIYGMLSSVYSARGFYEEAIQAAKSALEIAHETQDTLFEATSLAQLADAENSTGDRDSARGHYRDGRAIFVEIQDTLRVLQSDLKIARLDRAENRPEQAQNLALQVLESSRENDIMTTEVEALELLGDLETDTGDNLAAITEYTQALDRMSDTTWTSKVNTLQVKLANAYMDGNDLQASAPLMGALAGQPENVQSLKAQARFAFLRGNSQRAVDLMSRAKALAGEHWADESEATLQQYPGKQRP